MTVMIDPEQTYSDKNSKEEDAADLSGSWSFGFVAVDGVGQGKRR